MSTKLGTILADFTTALSTDIVVGGTTATLSSATDDDGVALPSGRYFFTLDGSNSSKEHISCDLVGTALTNIKSLSRQGVETTGVVRKHRIGTSVSLTDFGHIKFINDLISGATSLNASAPLGYDAAPSALSGNQLATVTYVLGVVSGGTVTFDQQIISNQTSGEALAINDVVYFKEADARWYKADADLTATFDQLQMGICKTTAVGASVTIQVAISGPVSGFTGLTAGSKYYLSNTAGAITTTPGTYSVFVGWALSTTVLLFDPILKTLPTQKEKDALVGSTGIPSSTNKYVTQDNTTSSSTDQSQLTQDSLIEVGEANATSKKNKLAQSFIPTKTKIRGVNLYKSADTGTFTGTVTVSLQADTAGSPSGSALATQTITNANWLQKSTGSLEILFSSEYSGITAGSLYWIVIETSTSDNSNHPNFGINTVGGYGSGSVKYNNTTDSWVAISTIDLYFATLEGNNSQTVKTNSSGQISTDLLKTALNGVVGGLTNGYAPLYFNYQIPIKLYESPTSGGATSVVSWARGDTNVVILGSGSGASLLSNGANYLMTESFVLNPAGAVMGAATFASTGTITVDWWASYQNTTNDTFMGFGTQLESFEQLYNGSTYSKVGFSVRASDGYIYATIAKAGVGATTSINTGKINLTKWNNYKIVLTLGTSAAFYVNGVLIATLSGANFPTSNTLALGFGRADTCQFMVTAPNVNVLMNS